MLGDQLLRVCLAFGVIGDGEVYDGRGFALGGFHDGGAEGVGNIGDAKAELLESVADGDCARRTVSLDHPGVQYVEAGYDECGARVV